MMGSIMSASALNASDSVDYDKRNIGQVTDTLRLLAGAITECYIVPAETRELRSILWTCFEARSNVLEPRSTLFSRNPSPGPITQAIINPGQPGQLQLLHGIF